MADNNRRLPENSNGEVYQPKSAGVQGLVFIGVLVSTPVLGWFVSHLLGGLSSNAQVAIYLSFFLIMFVGYGLWFVRLGAKAFSEIGKAALSAVFRLGKRKRAYNDEQGHLHMGEGRDQLNVALQRIASSFFIVSIPAGMGSGLCATLYESAVEAWLSVCIVFGACLLWGFLLTQLAKRGCFPPLPSDDQ
jgi:hypothetical protein